MSLYDLIISVYPELKTNDEAFKTVIKLQDDGDGKSYIAKWEYTKPLDKTLESYKR